MSSQPSQSGQPGAPVEPSQDLHHLQAQRRSNREAVRALGLEPYGTKVDGLITLATARAKYDAQADADFQASGKQPGFVDGRPTATVAGRVMLLRDGGKLIWLTLRDGTGDLQVAVSQRDVGEKAFQLAKLTDLSDVLVASGRLMKTKTGEITLWASGPDGLAPGAKSLVPPPEKHAGLTDVELRYRQRYVDLWANPETMRVFEQRCAIIACVRRHLEKAGYMEVETPMLQALAGGAAARPFITKMNALDINLYMRIAPELYLKRLLVGGMPRVFEINRNFRNEGLDKQHNPEFTMLEAYHAFGDVDTVMQLTEGIIKDAAREVYAAQHGAAPGDGSLTLPFGDLVIDYGSPFLRISYGELFRKAYGFDMTDDAKARATLKQLHPRLAPQVDGMDGVMVVNELFEDKQRGGEAQLDPSRPTFITDYPAAISPLTRPKRDNPVLADRADLFIAGMEIAPHYTELNDPDVQEAKFREQLKGADAEKNAEESTFRTMDHDFLRALKVGMPPAGGMGLGIDRLVMLLTNQRTIRDVLLFPLMKPE